MVDQTDWRSDLSAARAQMVTLGNETPMTEKTSGAAGSGGQASRFDHRHPRLTSPHTGTLNASGEASLTFSRQFTAMPAMAFGWVEAANNPPVMFKVVKWLKPDPAGGSTLVDWTSGAVYAGAVIKGYRGQLLPNTLTLLSQLLQFNVFNGSASGVTFTATAIQVGDVPTN